MAITINGSGTITGISAGGLPDGSVSTADLADGAVTDAKINGMSSSKLSGALPAIDGSALTGVGGGGKVLQVVTNVPSYGETEVTSASWTEFTTSWRTNITPTSSTSYIYAFLNLAFNTNNDSGNDSGGGFRVSRWDGSTHNSITGGANYRRNYDRGGSGLLLETSQVTNGYYDHNTTSQLTFSVQMYRQAGDWVRSIGNGQSQLILMEVEQ